MCNRPRSVLVCATIGLLAHFCNGMPTTPNQDTSPYSFYYKVFDRENNNYQGHVQRTDGDGVKSGSYYHLGPDGIWYETVYTDDGNGLMSENHKYESADDLSLNAFGPEDEKFRSDEGQIVIANGAGVIGGTMYPVESDAPLITTRTRGPISENDIRDSILSDFPPNRQIVFGSGPTANRGSFPMTFPSRPSPPRTDGREIVFGGSRNDIDQDIRPEQPVPEVSRPTNNVGPSFDVGFDSLNPTPFIGEPSVDGNVLPEVQPDNNIQETVVEQLPTAADPVNDFNAGFDELFG